MPTSDWELGFLGTPPPGGGGGGHRHGGDHGPGGFVDIPGYYVEDMLFSPMVTVCPPGTAFDYTGKACHPVEKLAGLGQFNTLQTVAGAMGVNTAGMQKDIQNLEKNAEMYVYAQLGLQTVAAAATFGLFLMMFYKFMRERKKKGI